MKLLVLGASGGCGRHVVRLAIERGHAVAAVVRSHAKLDEPAAIVVRDDVLRPGAIEAAAHDCDAVISCLGIRRRFPRNPWSRMLSPPDFTSRSAHAVVAAARAAGISRVLAISAAGVADSWPRMHPLLRFVFARSRIGDAYRDLAAMEQVYASSGLDWTCIRPVTLSPGKLRGYREVDRYALAATISRATVASWLLDHVTASGARTPMIGASR